MTTNRKCYNQICPMSTALDVVGDRWTILILRELLGGPARFQDLNRGLPGIAKNLLTARLRQLELDGLVRRDSVGTSSLYVLTELGESSRSVLEALGMWGARLERVGPAEHGRSVRATAMALHSMLVRRPELMPDDRLVVELIVGDEGMEIVLGPKPRALVRSADSPKARIQVTSTDMASFLRSGPGDGHGFSLISGSQAAFDRFRRAVLRLGYS